MKGPAARALRRSRVSRGEEGLVLFLVHAGISGYTREHPFHPTRRWRFDFAWPEKKIAVEVEGAVHRIKGRFAPDLEKYAEAMRLGWTVWRFSPAQIHNGYAINYLRPLFGKPVEKWFAEAIGVEP